MRFLIQGLAILAVTTMAYAGPESSSPTSRLVGSRTGAFPSKLEPAASTKSRLNKMDGIEGSIDAGYRKLQNESKGNTQNLKDQIQTIQQQNKNSRVRSCNAC